jgi:galactose oxidase-like protein
MASVANISPHLQCWITDSLKIMEYHWLAMPDIGSGKISRGQFLKLIGAAATIAVVGRFADLTSFVKPQSSKTIDSGIIQANAQSAGQWNTGPLASITPIHVALLPSGKILIVAGSGYHVFSMDGPFQAKVVDADSGDEISYTFNEDLFCSGHCMLANGNVLIGGGTLSFDVQNPSGQFLGLKAAYEYNVQTNQFQKVADMRHGRWYPTMVTLGDGKVYVLDGLDEYGSRNALVEIYNPTTKTFSLQFNPNSNLTYCVGEDSPLPGAGSPCYGGPNNGVTPFTSFYPRLHLMPSGLLVVCGMDNEIYLINPSTGVWTFVGTTQFPWRDYGNTFLLPLNNTATERGKVLIIGGQDGEVDPATATCEMLDFDAGTNTNPVRRNTASLSVARKFGLPVILPTGKLAVFGGTRGLTFDYVHTPESFDPVSETWTTLPDAGVSRSYHSTALLLADGRVWTASGTPDRYTWERRTEIFSPSYMFAGSRPSINGRVTVGPYGGTIQIPTANPSGVASVSLVRLMSTTHHYSTDQRLIWLQIQSTTSNRVTVSAPINSNVAPPGYYMIHILNSAGIPSVSQIIQIQ